MSKHLKYLTIAAGISRHKLDDRNYYLGAIGLRSDGTTVMSWNGAPKEPTRQHHCEYRLCRKLTPGSTVYIARTLADGTWANAHPCPDCLKILTSKGIRRCYYTISSNEYGVIDFG
jgi:tRNA(Arg) A34 adenosine deaminase TadA